ncbi:MAG: methylisocitrate lyase [Akkermansiaceae bacterium]|nr:methylisocitrate lyase [Akkermansiaceae bacterium]NNM30454.1 methylisocitrate lyase [Akkermansiaceae bacterium]
MPETTSSGGGLREAVEHERPVQVLGAVNACAAIMAERLGARALYLSGAGVANASFGLPDLGFTTLENVCEDARRISAVTRVPLLVDADTGWDDPGESVAALAAAGAAGCHLEDQVSAKRCGHRPGKALVPTAEMVARLETAGKGRPGPAFVLMARTDAAASEGLGAAIDRANAYVAAGADMIFAEALTDLDSFRRFADEVPVPVLANMTEFGTTPMHTAGDFGAAGIALVLYPLSAFRSMNKAAENTYRTILATGSQQDVLDGMQTREELYEYLDYHDAEAEQDRRRI